MLTKSSWTVAVICGLVLLLTSGAKCERWSRQVANSEWIPLTSPKRHQIPGENVGPDRANGLPAALNQEVPQIQQIALSPALQLQYQTQLLQLQRTQDNILKLLSLQQQIKNQQIQIQNQGHAESAQSGGDYEKQALRPSGADGTHGISSSDNGASGVLSPPTETAAPVFAEPSIVYKQDYPSNEDGTNGSQDYRHSHKTQQYDAGHHPPKYNINSGTHYKVSRVRNKDVGQQTRGQNQDSEENEEIQLVYVPAETLTQRDQPKSQTHLRTPQKLKQYHEETYPTQTTPSPQTGTTYTRALLEQIQREQDEKNKFFETERLKELARLQNERQVLEQNAKSQLAQRNKQELEKLAEEDELERKNLERIQEQARIRELQRLRQNAERSKVGIQSKKETGRKLEFERDNHDKYDKPIETEEEPLPEKPKIQQTKTHAQPGIEQQNKQHQHQSSVRNIKNNRVRNRLRPKTSPNRDHRDQEITTPSPNQPPLAVYMDTTDLETNHVKITDLLKILKNAQTISIVDAIDSETPNVFVGPSNLNPPPRFIKFDLPYLSSIENNLVDKKIENLPFFVAPVSFKPPPGFSKILFPAPHVGSFVVNTQGPDSEADGTHQSLPNSRLSIRQNSPINNEQPEDTKEFERPKPYYSKPAPLFRNHNLTKNHGRVRFPQPSTHQEERTVPPAVTTYDDRSVSRTEKPKHRLTYSSLSPTTTPTYPGPRVINSYSYQANFLTNRQKAQDHQDNLANHQGINENEQLDAQLDVSQFRENEQRQQLKVHPTRRVPVNSGYNEQLQQFEENPGDVDLTQYSLPAELPAISPHLPGLVNALVERNETITVATTTSTTTTTTEAPTTTSRSRGRQRGRLTNRVTTTTRKPPSRVSTTERARRPINRARTRPTTTTEAYQEVDESTEVKLDVSTEYEPEKRRGPTTKPKKQNRNQNLDSRTTLAANREKTTQRHYVSSQTRTPVTNADRYSTTNLPTYSVANNPTYLISTPTPTTKATYQLSPKEEEQVRENLNDQGNVYNYRAQTESSVYESPQTVKDYSYYQTDKGKEPIYQQPETAQVAKSEDLTNEDYPSGYGQDQEQYGAQDFEKTDIKPARINASLQDVPGTKKQSDYYYRQNKEEIGARRTVPSTTREPLIRTRSRTRPVTRIQQEPEVQIRPNGSEEEYVRFSAVNQETDDDPSYVNRQNQQVKKTRARPQTNYNPIIQTDSQGYVRIRTPERYETKTLPSAYTTSVRSDEPEDDSVGIYQPQVEQEDKYYVAIPYRQNPVNQQYVQKYALPVQEESLDDNDQGELTGHIPRKYKLTVPLSGNIRTYSTQEPYPDINGAESQWSTKLLPATTYNKLIRHSEKSEDKNLNELFETTSTQPEMVNAVPVMPVQNTERDQPSESIETSLSNFGDRQNETSGIVETTTDVAVKKNDLESNSNETQVEDKVDRPRIIKNKHRRKRVRVRVRPIKDHDMAESQHRDNSFNLLSNSPARPAEMMKISPSKQEDIMNDVPREVINGPPTSDNSPYPNDLTTEIPTSSQGFEEKITTPETEITTENYFSGETNNPSTEETMTMTNQINFEEMTTTIFEIPTNSEEKTAKDETENKEFPTETPENIEKRELDFTKGNFKGTDIFSRLSQDLSEFQDSRKKEDPAPDNHPKNHRTKWTEVRYPTDRSILDYGKYYANKAEDTTQDSRNNTKRISSVMTYSDDFANKKSLSEYVKDIFESIKVDSSSSKVKNKMKNVDSEKLDSTDKSSDDRQDIERANDDDSGDSVTTTPTLTTTTGKFHRLGHSSRTSTVTRVSQMTEICYRGKCVMSRPKRDSDA